VLGGDVKQLLDGVFDDVFRCPKVLREPRIMHATSKGLWPSPLRPRLYPSRRSDCMSMSPRQACWCAWGSVCQLGCLGRSWAETQACEEVVLATEDSTTVFCQSTLKQPRLRTETRAQCWRELSAYCSVAMARISLNWQYTLSTPSTEGGGNVSRSMAVAATCWLALAKVGRCLPLPLVAGATPLA
jgi:hypothetical protein